MLQYTKDCPKCNVPIEKNLGCYHMTCTSTTCKHQFCWICLSDWQSSHYSCAVEKTQAENKRDLQSRYHVANLTFRQMIAIFNEKYQNTSRIRSLIQYRISDLIRVKAKEEDLLCVIRSGELLSFGHKLNNNIAVWGHHLNEAKLPGQKQLRHFAQLLDGNMYVIIDLLSISGKKFSPPDLKMFCDIFKTNILKFKIEAERVRYAIIDLNTPKEEVEKTIIIRRYGKERGGKRIPKPSCLEELNIVGGEALGIMPVKVRDCYGCEIPYQDIPYLRNNEIVTLSAEEDEM